MAAHPPIHTPAPANQKQRLIPSVSACALAKAAQGPALSPSRERWDAEHACAVGGGPTCFVKSARGEVGLCVTRRGRPGLPLPRALHPRTWACSYRRHSQTPGRLPPTWEPDVLVESSTLLEPTELPAGEGASTPTKR